VWFYNKLGKRSENIKTAIPHIRTVMVFCCTPFHSFKRIPHILLKITFNDIRILHEKASIIGELAKKLLPIPNPKN
jgi:hypothetical protein